MCETQDSLWTFFFFQAEDGIRDLTVTGVQTCALPISRGVPRGGGRVSPARRATGGRGGGSDARRRPLGRERAARRRVRGRRGPLARAPVPPRDRRSGAPPPPGGALLRHAPGGHAAHAAGPARLGGPRP